MIFAIGFSIGFIAGCVFVLLIGAAVDEYDQNNP